MKFKISKSDLMPALTSTGKALGKSTLPIMECYHFKLENNVLKITAGTMAMSITKKLEVEGDNIDIAIPANRLTNWVRELADQPIGFEIVDLGEKGLKAKITTNGGSCEIPIEKGENYPKMVVSESFSINANANELIDCVSKTIFACASDEMRPELTGVNIEFENGKTTYTATNAQILCTFSHETEPHLYKANVVVPPGAMSAIMAIGASKECTITVCEKNIKFSFEEGIEVKTVLIESMSPFPNYRAIIPYQNDKIVTIDRRSLLSALKRATQFTLFGIVKVELKENKIKITADNSNTSEFAEEILDVSFDGDGLVIGLNAQHLIQALGKLAYDSVTLLFGTRLKPVIIVDELSDKPLQDLMMAVAYNLEAQ